MEYNISEKKGGIIGMLTEFGKALRRIRLDNDELLKDMADKLKVSSAYLSAVENGKKNLIYARLAGGGERWP